MGIYNNLSIIIQEEVDKTGENWGQIKREVERVLSGAISIIEASATTQSIIYRWENEVVCK